MTNIYIHEFPGIQRHFSTLAPDEASDVETARRALEGICGLAEGLFEPLAVELELALCDRETFTTRDHPNPLRRWMLVRELVPSDVDTVEDPEHFELVTCKRLTLTAMAEFVADAFSQRVDGPEDMLTWQTMSIRTTCAKLPPSIDGQTVAVDLGAGTIAHPIERRGSSGWVYGPRGYSTLVAPIELLVLNHLGELTITMSVHWSLWSRPGSPGYPQVDRAVERLLARGWTEDL